MNAGLQPSFEFCLLRRIAVGLQNFEKNNHDWIRFGHRFRGRVKDYVLRALSLAGWEHRNPDSTVHIANRLSDLEPLMDGLGWLFNRLADENSRRTLIDVIAYRVLGSRHVRLAGVEHNYWSAVNTARRLVTRKRTHPISVLDGWLDDYDLERHGYALRLRAHRLNIVTTFLLEQYRFNVADGGIGAKPGGIVIDGGGCWGDTALYFADKVGDAGQVHVFEFSPANLAVLRHNLQVNSKVSERIHVQECGLWNDSQGVVRFDEAGPGTHLMPDTQTGNSGSLQAPVTSLDRWVAMCRIPNVDLIKLDIEGAERQALEGARETIASRLPQLAVAIYHSLEDVVGLPRLIAEIHPCYKLYLGHYTIHSEETILFATPS